MLKVLELFSGIGACSKALTNLGIEHEIVDAVEIDKYAIKSFNAVHGTNFEPQDITKWDKDIECDLIMHGSPCQDFSVAGKQAGGDEGSGTRSSLMYETLRIVEKLKPKYVIWENVKNLLSKKHRHNFDAYLEAMEKLGYKNYYQVLNAKNYGVPQNRERVFTVSILDGDKYLFPEPVPLEKKLKDILEKEVDEKYYLSEDRLNVIYAWEKRQKENGRGFRFEVKDGNSIGRAVTTNGDRPSSTNYVAIKTANTTGYDLAKDGDGIDLAYPKSTTRRGRVGHGVAKTITTSDNMGVVVDDMYKNREPRVYNETSPTLRSERTGLKVVEPNLKTKLCNELVKEGVVKGGEIINHSYTTSKQRNTLDKYIETKNGVMPTMTTRPDILGYVENNPVRIRKLTPKECWRLMGFDDASFERAEKVNSNAQLYKQAGNSIVVDVLMAIFKELFSGGQG